MLRNIVRLKYPAAPWNSSWLITRLVATEAAEDLERKKVASLSCNACGYKCIQVSLACLVSVYPALHVMVGFVVLGKPVRMLRCPPVHSHLSCC